MNSAEIRAWFEDWQQKVRAEGREEGRKAGARRVLLLQLRGQFGELPAAVLAHVESAEVDEIEGWSDRLVLGAKTVDEVLGKSR